MSGHQLLGAIQKLGVVGTVGATIANLGCCSWVVLGPLTGVVSTWGVLDRIPPAWQGPLLYGFLAATLVGFGLGWRRHRRLTPILLFLPGAATLLYPLHEPLGVSVLRALIWLGFGLLLVAAVWDTWLSFGTRACRFTLSRSEASP